MRRGLLTARICRMLAGACKLIPGSLSGLVPGGLPLERSVGVVQRVCKLGALASGRKTALSRQERAEAAGAGADH